MRIILLLLLTMMACWSCDPMSGYRRQMAKELATGERHDSLFLGIYLGMPAKDFFGHCWQLNKQGLVKEGPQNASVQYALGELKAPGKMYFYPDFHEDKIHKMRLTFSYDAWAIWNKELYSDKLIQDVIRIFERWYGGQFMEIKGKKGHSVFVHIDGNRRISLWIKDDMLVRGLITDMSIDPGDKKNNSVLD
ncbi:MAG: hypothetical protein IPN33_04970 [Saprospiraceae bacterium]|nr:hypothetical protein [Saprospiraceae bacterium]